MIQMFDYKCHSSLSHFLDSPAGISFIRFACLPAQEKIQVFRSLSKKEQDEVRKIVTSILTTSIAEKLDQVLVIKITQTTNPNFPGEFSSSVEGDFHNN